MSKKRNIKLGKSQNGKYEYEANINFSSSQNNQLDQLSAALKEKEINNVINNKVAELDLIKQKGKKREKNLEYYYSVGKELLFLDEKPMDKVVLGSAFRRIIEELPDLVDVGGTSMKIRHLTMMYKIGHVSEQKISQASWDQWFEITKFKNVYNNKGVLERVLNKCTEETKGHSTLNKIIKDILQEKQLK